LTAEPASIGVLGAHALVSAHISHCFPPACSFLERPSVSPNMRMPDPLA
jgi:hypothetical protein